MTWGSSGRNLSAAEMSDLIKTCIDSGINTFDHADIYGGYTTEETFGDARLMSGVSRNNIRLISKCGIQYPSEKRPLKVKYYEYSAQYIIWSVEHSLMNLRTDYLDLLLLHRPSPLMHPDEISEAIARLKSDGKIIDFGVSNFTPSQTELIAARTVVAVNQIQFSLTHPDPMTDGSLDHMFRTGIRPMAWNPLGTVFREETPQTERIKNELVHMMAKYDAPADVILLAWILKHPAGIIPVVGTTSAERLKQLPKALAIDMETEDWFVLWVAARGMKVP